MSYDGNKHFPIISLWEPIVQHIKKGHHSGKINCTLLVFKFVFKDLNKIYKICVFHKKSGKKPEMWPKTRMPR